jgi:hypothetical protein
MFLPECLKRTLQIPLGTNGAPELFKIPSGILHLYGDLMFFIFQKMPDVLIDPVVKILHHLQPLSLVKFMKGYLVNTFAISPDQASVPDPPPVITLHGILPVPDQVNVIGIPCKILLHSARKPDQPVICLNVLIGIVEPLFSQQTGPGFMCAGIIRYVPAGPDKGQGAASSGAQYKYPHGLMI